MFYNNILQVILYLLMYNFRNNISIVLYEICTTYGSIVCYYRTYAVVSLTYSNLVNKLSNPHTMLLYYNVTVHLIYSLNSESSCEYIHPSSTD